MDTLDVRNDADHNRYELYIDGDRVGEIDYNIAGNDIHLTHTVVSKDRREHGLASGFVQQVLDGLRTDTDLRLVPDCPYVAHWLTEHEDYTDLLDR